MTDLENQIDEDIDWDKIDKKFKIENYINNPNLKKKNFNILDVYED